MSEGRRGFFVLKFREQLTRQAAPLPHKGTGYPQRTAVFVADPVADPVAASSYKLFCAFCTPSKPVNESRLINTLVSYSGSLSSFILSIRSLGKM